MSKKYFLSSLIILVFFIMPFPVLAAGIKYFEFAPDTGLKANIGSIDVYQPFYPNNDFVSGFDVWIDNPGDSGTISFKLKDAQNNFLAHKTVSIYSIPPSWSGGVFHVDFDNPVSVSSTALYKIEMTTTMPNLRLYYANQIQLIQHNNVQVPVTSILGPVFFGDVPQDFFFKIALYENGDTNPPVISNVTSSLISSHSLKLEFNTDEPVDYQMTLTPAQGGMGQVKDWNGFYEFCNVGIQNCGATFSVEPNTSYNYQIAVKDYADNSSQVNGMVTTAENQENSLGNPPVISNGRFIAVTPNSVKIAWQTDIAANSELLISHDSLGGQVVTSVNDATFELEHTLQTSNVLVPGMGYFAAIRSTASNGQSARQILSFTTSESESTSSQDQSNQNQTTSTQNLNEPIVGTTTIEWTEPSTGEPQGGYRVDIFNTDNKLVKRIAAQIDSHKIEITDLPPGNYRFVAYADQGNYFEKIAKETTFKIAEKSLPFSRRSLIYKISIPTILIGIIAGFYILRVRKINRQ